jgi:hypothetical protein
MVVEILRDYELWDTQPPLLRKPSRLFHLEPIGLNTGYVESLTSYVARLALAHSVPLGTLLAIEVKPMLKDSRDENPLNSHSMGTLYGQTSVKALNGTQTGARQLVKALEVLTLRHDLQFLTLLPWAFVFPVVGLLKHFQGWCPDCYQQWLNHKQVIYSPLLWALQVVKICPVHHRPLESQCPHCHRQFLPLWRNSRPGFCLQCGGWLGTNSELSPQLENLFSETAKLERQIWIVKTLGELIAQAQCFSFPPPRETIKKMLKAYVHEYTSGNVSAMGRWLGLPRHEILRWCSGATIPNLEQLLNICYTLSTSLVDFLQMKVVALSSKKLASLSIRKRKRPPPPEQVSSRTSLKKEQVIQAMELALEEEPPPSLTQLALRLGFKSYSSLTTCSKSLSAVLKARYADYQQQIRQERIRNALTSALFSDESPPPSLRKLAQRTGIDLATFECYYPTLCHAISLRYQDYRKFQKKQKIVLGCREVRRLVPKLDELGITPSVKNLRKFMQYPATLWYPEVIEVLNQLRSSLKQ